MILFSLGRKNVFIMVPNNNDFITESQLFVHKRGGSHLGGGWYVIKTTKLRMPVPQCQAAFAK